jgi:hypothetical protein
LPFADPKMSPESGWRSNFANRVILNLRLHQLYPAPRWSTGESIASNSRRKVNDDREDSHTGRISWFILARSRGDLAVCFAQYANEAKRFV